MKSISIMRGSTLLARKEGTEDVWLVYRGEYLPGDRAVFVSDEGRAVVRVDGHVAPARVFLPEGRFEYRFPVEGDGLLAYAPGAFSGDIHLLCLSPDTENERRNLAENPADQRGSTEAFPHVSANVETRNESVFAARNVIDGLCSADGHGPWPYESWGIGARTDAEITLDFGRDVRIDAMALYLRADFPHDAHWVEAAAEFSDGSSLIFPLEQRDGPQRVQFEEKTVRFVKLCRLIKSNHPSAFPALRQWKVFGRDLD